MSRICISLDKETEDLAYTYLNNLLADGVEMTISQLVRFCIRSTLKDRVKNEVQ